MPTQEATNPEGKSTMLSSEATATRSPSLENYSEKDTGVVFHRSDMSDDTSSEIEPKIGAKTFLAVVAVCLIYVAQDFTLVGAGAQGNTIAAHFDSAGDVTWITAPVTILTVVLCPIVSQAADYWGRKWFLVGLTLLGAAGSAIVARSSNMAMCIAGFTVIGSAFGAQALLHTVASEVLPRRWRSWAQASIMVSNGVGLGSGLLVEGALNRHADPNGFRYFFYISMALFAISALICALVYQPLPTKLQLELSFSEKMGRLDWVGYALMAFSLVLFCLGLSWSQNPYPWSDPHVAATFSIGLALAVGLVVYETYFIKDGMFHHGLFRNNRNFAIAILCVFAEGIAFFAANIYFAFEVAVLYETDVFIVGVRFAIAFLVVIFGSLATGLYGAITKKLRWVTFTAFVVFTIFFVLMATATPSSSKQVWGYPIFMGWGLGMTLVALVSVAQISTPPELISIASGLIISVRSLGGTIGIAIYNSVFISATRHIPANIAAAGIAAGLPTSSVTQYVGDVVAQNATGLATIPGISPAIIGAGVEAVLDTYSTGFRNVWITAIPFIVLAAICSTFIIDNEKEFNNHIDAPVEKK